MARWPAVTALLMLWTPLSPAEPGAEIRSDALNPSELCGECHEEIYAMWRRSMHSGSYTDPIFKASYMQAYLETGGAARQVCLRCHAPGAVLPGSDKAPEADPREGIACDYCHSVVSVDLDHETQPFRIRVDGIKRGPLGGVESPAHKVATSPLHKSAEFCAGCHEYTNPEGLPIFTTYSEWRLSPQAAQGKTCQHCHMPATPGRTVRSDLDSSRTSINLHDISGMHSSEQVRKAATARILSVTWQKLKTAVVEVEVANIGSGHSIPTGLPTRRLVLEAVLYVDGIEVKRFERSYQKTLLDADGHLITEDHRTILAARKLLEDNRLKAGERRVEKFFASVPQQGLLQAEVRLRYSYEPMLLSREKILIELASQRFP